MQPVPLSAIPAAAFGRGAIAALPLQLATLPFGLIFGAIAVQAGLDLVQTMAMTVIVVAGAAQLAAIAQMTEHAPALLAILVGAVVNARLAMYSASIAPAWPGASLGTRALAAFLLHDHAYAMAMRRHADRPAEGTADRIGFFLGVGIITVVVWVGGALAGALIGGRLPPEWGLEFAAPVSFIALFAPLLRDPAHLAAAMTAALGALLLAPLPLGLGLMAGAAAGVAVGATVEAAVARWRGRRGGEA
ncbi:MAG: AzlC family ABC transporter permease [Rubrimonas sp.]